MLQKPNKKLIIIIAVFGIIFSLISIFNHYNFRTFALDLGAYTNALYDYIHFQWNDSTVFKEVAENLLSDHFDLYLIIFSPLSLLFGTYTLLIVQIAFILFGGIGVYKFFNLSEKTVKISLFATTYFYLFFGVFAAVSFDYHSNIIAASLIPWFFYLFKSRKLVGSSILLILIIISKENTSLWLSFVCAGIAIEYWKDKLLRNYLLLASLFSAIYFVSVISFIMPAFSNNGIYPHFHYSILGSNFSEAIIHLLSHPLESLKVIFTNHINHPLGDYVKTELHILLILSGLPLLIRKPQFLFMLIPIYFQKLFHDNYFMWGIGSQYSIEFAPILSIGIFMVISEFKNLKLIKIASIIILVLTLAVTLRTMDNTVLFTNKSNIRFYKASHYSRKYNVDKIHKLLSEIPKDAVISSQSPFLPHLALRDNIYQFPIIKDAGYIIYSKNEEKYPMKEDAFYSFTAELENSPDWIIINKDEDIVILRKSVY